jgi:hypothetical protein
VTNQCRRLSPSCGLFDREILKVLLRKVSEGA